MARIFLSHSSADAVQAMAVRDWLADNGWRDVFLDLDPERGLKAGERWQEALKKAARRCEAVLFLDSAHWLRSRWCQAEFLLAKSLDKRIFAAIVDATCVDDVPVELSGEWQLVDLAAEPRRVLLQVRDEDAGLAGGVAFNKAGLARLRIGLLRAGLDPNHFDWPPASDPQRVPYRGLRPLEEEDAGIFFGREAPIVAAVDQLLRLRAAATPTLFVVVGASGAGKSSFMRAGIIPRLKRSEHHIVVLPVVRPELASISGNAGLLSALERVCADAGLRRSRAQLSTMLAAPGPKLVELLQVPNAQAGTADGPAAPYATVVLPIDQGEELFMSEGAAEADRFFSALAYLLSSSGLSLLVVMTIRSDSYELLQGRAELESIRKLPFDLSPLPRGSFGEVIRGPIHRLKGSAREVRLDEALVDAILRELEGDGARDGLALLSFTLERLFVDFSGGGRIGLDDYIKTGGIKGSIETAIERAIATTRRQGIDAPDRAEVLARLHRAFIPWLALIDPATGTARRRVALYSEIPAASRPLIEAMVAQGLLLADVAADRSSRTIEVAHETILRQWDELQGWLQRDAEALVAIDGVRRASRDWHRHDQAGTWLVHTGERLRAVEWVLQRSDLQRLLEGADTVYLDVCQAQTRRQHEQETKSFRERRIRNLALQSALLAIIAGLLGWIYQDALRAQWHWWTVVRPYQQQEVERYVLTPQQEAALAPASVFRECRELCPQMVVIPEGRTAMGSPDGDGEAEEHPRHEVAFARRFAVAKYEVSFDEWDRCVQLGGCPAVPDSGLGRGRNPVVNVSWLHARQYAAWLSLMTGQDYRLLTEAEWEYAARGGSSATYSFGTDLRDICQYGNVPDRAARERYSDWKVVDCDDHSPNLAPVGSYQANGYGLHDMYGNVWEWVQDGWHPNYAGAPVDGSEWRGGDPALRIQRGGAWVGLTEIRTATRFKSPPEATYDRVGIRVARTLRVAGDPSRPATLAP